MQLRFGSVGLLLWFHLFYVCAVLVFVFGVFCWWCVFPPPPKSSYQGNLEMKMKDRYTPVT